MEYTSAFARNITDIEPEQGKRRATRIRFRAVAKGKDENGKWRQKSTNLEVDKGTGKNAEEKTSVNIQNALETWRKALNEVESVKDAKASVRPSLSVYDIVANDVERRAKLSEAVGWDTTKKLPNNEKVIVRSTVRDYHHTMRVIEPAFSRVSADELTMQFVLDWEEKKLMDGASISRIRKAHVLLKQSLNNAVIRGLIKANVMAPLKAPTIERKQNIALTQEDMKRVTATLMKMEPTPVVVGAMLALHCGLRGGEICGLAWDSVDFDSRLVRVVQSVGIADGGKFLKPPKSDSGKRSVYMDDYVMTTLIKRRSLMLKERDNIKLSFGDLYVVGDIDGGYLSPTTLSRQWTALSTAWGLTGKEGGRVTLHKMRHSFVDAVRGGKGATDNKTLTDVVGHSTVAMTDKYGTGNQEAQNEAVMAASAWMAPDSGTQTEAELYSFTSGIEDNVTLPIAK